MIISIVIPAHNEEGNIKTILNRVMETISHPYEVVVVDDHSEDATAKIVREFTEENSFVKLVHNHRAKGFSNALITGFESASGEVAVPVMADLCRVIGLLKSLLVGERELLVNPVSEFFVRQKIISTGTSGQY